MSTKTRYFVIVSLLVLGIGFGTGLVAYYVGFPAGALASRGGPADLNFIPRDASVIAFANVNEIMASELRQKLRRAIPMQENGQQEFESADRHQPRNRHRHRRGVPEPRGRERQYAPAREWCWRAAGSTRRRSKP